MYEKGNEITLVSDAYLTWFQNGKYKKKLHIEGYKITWLLEATFNRSRNRMVLPFGILTFTPFLAGSLEKEI